MLSNLQIFYVLNNKAIFPLCIFDTDLNHNSRKAMLKAENIPVLSVFSDVHEI